MRPYIDLGELMADKEINPTRPILFVKRRGSGAVECISEFCDEDDTVFINGNKTTMEELYEGFSDLGGKPLGKT